MPELRKDPVLRRWVIIATERSKRPSDFAGDPGPQKPAAAAGCPFCPGNECMTPPEIIAFRDSKSQRNGPGWWVRVVANKFPALAVEGDLNKAGVGIYDMMNGVGAHEVIIETPRHDCSPADLSDHEIEEIVWAYRDRYMDLKKDDRLKYILIFRNYGQVAGASREHPHSQLIATPIVPKRINEEMEGARQYYQYKERCIFCDIVLQELSFGAERLVAENEDFVAFCPFASRFPFELWVVPRKHHSGFGAISKVEMANFARIIGNILWKYKKTLNDPPYNYVIHTSPANDEEREDYHWHMELLPRLTTPAGFEWGSGFYINPVPPEDAARHLREAGDRPAEFGATQSGITEGMAHASEQI